MSKAVLTFEGFEKLCLPEAELLEEELRDWGVREQEWKFVFDLGGRVLLKWKDNEGFYLGTIFPIKDGRWDFPLLRLSRKKSA